MTSVVTAAEVAGLVSSIPFAMCGVVLFRAFVRRLRPKPRSAPTTLAQEGSRA